MASRQLWAIAAVQVLAMALWFSASAVGQDLAREWALTSTGESMLTTAVQLGFVTGALGSAALSLADRVPAHLLMAAAAACGAAANACVALFSDGLGSGVLLRFLTGVTLAGVYPVGMKIMTTWFTRGRGLALGVMVGALTIGSAAPQLVRTQGLPWESVVLASSVLAVLAALLTLAVVRPGPHQSPSPPFDPSYVIRMFRDRQQRLINFGYLGHMWELYALWAWVPLFVAGSFTAYNGRSLETADVAWSVFACMGLAGAVGCVVAGRLSGRLGSGRVASIALAVSGACCLLSPLVFGAHPALMWIFLALWGTTVIADSAQFSSALSEAAEPSYIGTALTVQTALGFLLTIVTIQALPLVATQVGWDSALLLLAIGPAVGVLSMTRLDRASTPDPFPDRQGTP